MTQNVKNQEAGSSQTQIRNVRIQKMENLRERGLNPYPYGYDKDIMAQDLQDKYKDLAAGEEIEDCYHVAGRVMANRNTGMFIDLVDASGKKSYEELHLKNAVYVDLNEDLAEIPDDFANGGIISGLYRQYRAYHPWFYDRSAAFELHPHRARERAADAPHHLPSRAETCAAARALLYGPGFCRHHYWLHGYRNDLWLAGYRPAVCERRA